MHKQKVIKMLKKIKIIIARLTELLWSLFLNGLLTLLPLTLTIAIFHLTFKLLKSWLEPVAAIRPDFLAWIPHVEIILTFAIIFIFGAILRFFLLKQLIHLIEVIFFQIPLIRPVYTGIKQLVNAFNPNNQLGFKKIVFIEFPRKGLYSIGFLTSELIADLAPDKEQKYYNIFVPTTPNPTSGYFVILPESEVTITRLSRQEAMAMIISGGIIQPDYSDKNHYRQ